MSFNNFNDLQLQNLPPLVKQANSSFGLQNQFGNFNQTSMNSYRSRAMSENFQQDGKGKLLSGWETYDQKIFNTSANNSIGTIFQGGLNSNSLSFLPVTENLLKSHEYENKLINTTIQLGGLRLKQADKLLEDFAKTAKNLNTQIVSSLLIHKLRFENLMFINKARLLYDIEVLVKRVDSPYFNFFQKNIGTLKSLRSEIKESNPSNLAQLKKIFDGIIKQLESPQLAGVNFENFEKDDVFDFIKPIKEEVRAENAGRNDDDEDFDFVEPAQVSSNEDEGLLDKKDRKSNNIPTSNGQISVTQLTNEKALKEHSINNLDELKPANQGKTKGEDYLNGNDFSGFDEASNHQQSAPGDRLDAMWNYANNCQRSANLEVEAALKRMQAEEIEDKFFGFVKLNDNSI